MCLCTGCFYKTRLTLIGCAADDGSDIGFKRIDIGGKAQVLLKSGPSRCVNRDTVIRVSICVKCLQHAGHQTDGVICFAGGATDEICWKNTLICHSQTTQCEVTNFECDRLTFFVFERAISACCARDVSAGVLHPFNC